MRYFSFFWILAICQVSFLHGQEYATGTIIDQQTLEPVPFVNIGIANRNVGTVSDENGYFRLKIPDPDDKVSISSIGYHIMEMPASELLRKQTIELRPRQYAIPEIELTATRFSKEVILGKKLEERKHSIGFGSSELGTEIAAHIRVERETLLKNALFPVNHAKGDSMYFRVNIHDFTNETVGENLMQQNVIIATRQKSGVIEVDLTPFNLVVSNDLLLSLEWIRDDKGEGNVGITFNSEKSRRGDNLYTRHTSQAPFKKLSKTYPGVPKLQLAFYLTGKTTDD